MSRHLLVNPLWACSEQCSYCWVISHVRHHPALNNMRPRPMEDWSNAIKRDTPDIITVGGGEPFLLPWLLDLVRAFPNIQWSLCTNGVMEDKIAELASHRLPQVCNVTLSYHPDSLKDPNYESRYRRQALMLRDAGYNLSPHLMDNPYNMAAGAETIQWLKDRGIHMIVSPLCGGREDSRYLQEQGLVCQGGIDHLVIAPDGTAWPCLSTLWSDWYEETCLGNWIDGTVDLSKRQQPCRIWCAEFEIQYGTHQNGDFFGTKARRP